MEKPHLSTSFCNGNMEYIAFKTNSGNEYLFSPSKRAVMPVSHNLRLELQNASDSTHSDEFISLKDASYLEEYKTEFARRISPHDIELALENLPQVIFEMTTSCNLRCKYCCYGDGYTTYKNRKSGALDFSVAKNVLDFIATLFSAKQSSRDCPQPFAISFYGGEPLMNFLVLEKIVDYSKTLQFEGRTPFFTMTTNAVLLKRYAAFLEDHDFRVLVSLDGNEVHDAYRIKPDGKPSFPIVHENLLYVKEHYPKLFSRIRFNAVFTDISEANEMVEFFDKEFGKVPQFSILREPDKGASNYDEIKLMCKPLTIPYKLSKMPDLLMESPIHKRIFDLSVRLSNNVFYDENDLLDKTPKQKYPTGTCIPFSKRMFVAFDGKLHPCEKVCRDHPLGEVTKRGVKIHIRNIVERFNLMLEKHSNICSHCYLQLCCTKCALQNQDSQCHLHVSKKQFAKVLSETYSYIEEHPSIVNQLKATITIK